MRKTQTRGRIAMRNPNVRNRGPGVSALSRRALLHRRNSLNDALQILWELKEDYSAPNCPRHTAAGSTSDISKQMGVLDLEKNIRWEGTSLWEPRVLPFLLKIIDRYALRIDPDEPLVFAVTAMDAGLVAKYYKRYPLSERALGTLKRLLTTPSSPRTLEEIVRFLDSSEIWCAEIAGSLKTLAARTQRTGVISGISCAESPLQTRH